MIEDFEQRAQRLAPGYTPRSAESLHDWLIERFLIPEDEWRDLCVAMIAEHGETASEWISLHSEKITTIALPGSEISCVVAGEKLGEVEASKARGS